MMQSRWKVILESNFANLVELVWHRGEVGNRNYENHV